VDVKEDIREFLTSRRARVKPEDAGLPAHKGRRRVLGLRREEVALLAGISVEYYTRIERGNVAGVSEDIMEGIATALRLDDAERAHLFDLVRTASMSAGRTPRRRPSQERVRPAVKQILESISAPAYVRNGRLDILAANPLGEALYAPLMQGDSGSPPNMARFVFLDDDATRFFAQWDGIASDVVAILRAEAGRDPYDRRLSDLVGELSTRSAEFRVRWAAHNVKFHRTGAKRLHHPIVGPLTLAYEVLELAGDGQRILIYTAEPQSASEDALALLASWSASVPS